MWAATANSQRARRIAKASSARDAGPPPPETVAQQVAQVLHTWSPKPPWEGDLHPSTCSELHLEAWKEVRSPSP